MLSNLKNNFRVSGRTLAVIRRNYVKRKYPVNREKEKTLPIFQYPLNTDWDKRVYAWGLCEHGALGNQRQRGKKKYLRYYQRPQRLYFGEQYRVNDVTCGYGFTVFSVKSSDRHKVFGTGLNADSQIGYHAPRKDNPLGMIVYPAPIELPFRHPSTAEVLQVSAGRAHLLILTNEGVFTLGNNAYGQCGRRIVQDEDYSGSHMVHRVSDVDGSPVKQVACGQDHSMFVSESGQVYSCGWGADGQTGLGCYNNEWKPSRVSGDIQGEKVVKLSCASDCVLALSDQGVVFGWGNSEYGQLDHSQTQVNVPREVLHCRGLGRIVDVASGGTSCMVLNEDGKVFVWGYGILGKGPNVDRLLQLSEIPPTLFGWNEFQPNSKVISVNAGISHQAAVTNCGDLFMWGLNRGGCLGLGHVKNQFFPLRVSVSASVIKVSLGVDHTMALCKSFV
ncbi:RCC1-like G exchanging factor-like protein [Bacillus rossius redtenbacheri]|uniref:RCC1-like G exchanging factor-like protein n=1 Tax=Bacillus rossius redtenbacheri TaxID=93214 RepID=UPI002FDD931E